MFAIIDLIGSAGLVLQEGNPQFAAHLLSAVESALKMLNAAVHVEVKFFHERTLVQIKEALGEEGSKWSLKEAVNKALA